MKRREALKSSVFLVGCGLSAASISSILSSGCKQTDTIAAETFLDIDTIDLLAEICETILPKTTTPGAKDAGVHLFLDYAVKHNLTPEDQTMFKAGIVTIKDLVKNKFKKSFVDLSADERNEAFAEVLNIKGDKNIGEVLIGLTKNAFFTSEVGAKQVLKYKAVPGPYRGCVELSEVGGTWSE